MSEDDALEEASGVALIEQISESDSTGLVKVTTYIREDQAFALEIMENAERQRRGKDFDQSELFQEALDLLIKARIVVLRRGRDLPVEKKALKE